MAWPGWGAGPAGAGSAGGPSRIFLVIALACACASAGLLLRDGRTVEGAVVALAALYFAARLLGLGRRRQ